MSASHGRFTVIILLAAFTLAAASAVPAFCVALQPGWPQSTGMSISSSSPALGDLDGDGTLEAVIGSLDHKVYAWHQDGVLVSGWPKSTSAYIFSSPALGDLDGDGDLEVVVGSDDNNVYAWHGDGTIVAGWPKATSGDVGSSPALGDLDGDGNPEVVCGAWDSRVYAWHGDGTPVPGWPQRMGSHWGMCGCPALGDLDGDGDLEVVAGCSDGSVYAWHGDATPVPGWPRHTGYNVMGSPALGDLDGDGDLEVVVGSWDYNVYAWHGDGTLVVGWPQSTGSFVDNSPALGDLDGDGDLEVVAGSFDGSVYAWHDDAVPVAGWPRSTGGRVYGSPALGDLDGDGGLEVVVGSDDTNVYAWHGDGAPVAGWRQATGAYVSSSPTIGDLDGDGDVEVVVGSGDYKVYAWTCEAPTGEPLPWPMLQHDARRTGRYGGPEEPPLTAGHLAGQVRANVTAVPIAGAVVEAYFGTQLQGAARTRDDGTYVIAGLDAGEYTVVARAQGYLGQAKTAIPVSAGQTTYVNFDLETTTTRGWIMGQVREWGTTTNVPTATVAAYLGGQLVATTRTDSRGIYLIETDRPSSEYVVSAAKVDYQTQTRWHISVALGNTTYVNFWLRRTPLLKGQVRDRTTGEPIIGAYVSVWRGGNRVACTLTQPRWGVYEFDVTTLGQGTYTLWASKPGYLPQSKWNVTVTLNETTYCNFNLESGDVPALKGQVRNRVTGAPLIGATVTARQTFGSATATGTTVTPWGIYEIFGDLPEGYYAVEATKEGYQPQPRAGIIVTPGLTTYVNFSLRQYSSQSLLRK